MSKEKKREEKSLDSKEEIRKENLLPLRVRTREEVLPPVIDVHTPPTLELLLAFAHKRCYFFDDDFTREFFHVMQDEFEWVHPKTKLPIDPWPPYFREWRLNRELFKALRDPERVRGKSASSKKPANYLASEGGVDEKAF